MNTGRSLSRPRPRTRSKNSGVQAAIIPETNRACSAGSYASPRRCRPGQGQGVGLAQVRRGLGVLAAGVEHLGQAEVQPRAVAVAQVRPGQHRRMAARSSSGSLPRSSVASCARAPA